MTRHSTGFNRREMLLGAAAAGSTLLLDSPVLAAAQAVESGAGLSAALAKDLGGRLRGPLTLPSDAQYDAARALWNGMIDKYPLAIAGCTGDSDVMAVIGFAREHGLDVTVRGGGHSVSGKALKDGAITIDLAPMQGIWVDAEAKRARAQGGVRWASFDRETLARNLYTTGGTVGSTGVAGLTLGGGLGWLMRKHGLSCDNLLGADVVTADGRAIRASESENADLYWALRGGGGNFGVVTSFEFALHDEEPVYGGVAFYPEDRIRDMLQLFRDYTGSAPDAVNAMAAIVPGPAESPLEGRPAGMVAFCHNGPLDQGEKLALPFRDFGPPVIDTMGPSTYAQQQGLFAAAGTPGMRNYWRSNFMRTLSDGAIDTLVEHAAELPPPGSMMLIEHMGGAVARVGDNETAFSNRDAEYNVSLLSSWVDPANDPENIAWTRAVGDELKSFATGGAYVNYMASDENAAAVRSAYETNFQRLVAVKRKYDPDNFFSSNQNIAP